ncbi:hypothetical protein FACS1894116_04860 [Betaproteobacteria bacterium]|nr:hypothetical protein FACS1894116_04860 [Betaproteobacteria bacterium]GHU28356.1 hypothetical protein FACS189497_03630 [Betaproteobacteria bacterium]
MAIDRSGDGGISGFHSAEYSLTEIHEGTGEATKKMSASESLENRQIEITCPKCLGKGDFWEMAIPEASYKLGLSDYGLFSENTICSYTGCPLCGGSGISYKEWYIKEKGISTENLPPLIRGSGRIVIG